jgi:hypothetical protein
MTPAPIGTSPPARRSFPFGRQTAHPKRDMTIAVWTAALLFITYYAAKAISFRRERAIITSCISSGNNNICDVSAKIKNFGFSVVGPKYYSSGYWVHVDYKTSRTFIDVVLEMFDVPLSITPSWHIISADEQGHIIEHYDAGGIYGK